MANEAEVKLFTTTISPYGQRVAIALKEKKIPFEAILVDLANKPKELLEANPIYKKVPTIIYNGNPVAESLVILEYLEDAFPEHVPLMPQDAFEKSKVRFWIDYSLKAVDTLKTATRAKPGTPEKQAAVEEALKALNTLEEGMASFSADGPFFTGATFGLVDVVLAPLCNLGPVLQELGMVIPGSDQLPRFNKWVEAVKVRPSVSSVVPSTEDTLGHLREFQKRAAAAAATTPPTA